MRPLSVTRGAGAEDGEVTHSLTGYKLISLEGRFAAVRPAAVVLLPS
jgi:hypothetical protein